MKNCRHSALALMLAFSMGALADPPTRTITRQPFDALSRKLDAANEAIQRVPELSAQIFKILLGKGSTHWVSPFYDPNSEVSGSAGGPNTVISVLNLGPLNVDVTVRWRAKDGLAVLPEVAEIEPQHLVTFDAPGQASWVEVTANKRVLVDGQVEVAYFVDNSPGGTNEIIRRHLRKMTWYSIGP